MLKIGVGVLSVVFFLTLVFLSGCGGGGGGETSAGTPALQSSLPTLTTYDFEAVTLGNSSAAKVVTLSNSGNAPLQVSNIELTGAAFILDLTNGIDSCGLPPFTIGAGKRCTLDINFSPIAAVSSHGTLSVSSNDPDRAIVDCFFTGTGVAVIIPTLQINRVASDVCPLSELSIYLSVMDQLGYPIPGLTEADFDVTEMLNSGPELPMTVNSPPASIGATLSVALVMDYSGSITDHPEVQAGMEAGVISFINQLGESDEAEIVKFDSDFEVVQRFTDGDAAGQTTLVAAVVEAWDMGRGTRLNDAIYQAVDDLALRSKDRKIVIVLSDGFDGTNPPDDPSDNTYVDARTHAVDEKVLVFPIGIAGAPEDLNGPILEALAADTGGQYFDTLVADDLNTIYQQLAQILFVDQYLLTYDSGFNPGDSALLKVGVTVSGNVGEDSRTIIACPP